MKQAIPKLTSAIVYACNPALFDALERKARDYDEDLLEALDSHLSVDPAASRWDSEGFVKMPTLDWFSISNNHVTFCIQINERKLPAKVRDELVQTKADVLKRQQGRNVTKKEYRLLVEEAEMELLPKAFIGRTQALVSITKGKVIVWTSSMKRADRIVNSLTSMLSSANIELEDFGFANIATLQTPSTAFTRIVKGRPGDDDTLAAGYACVLKASEGSSENPTIRVRNQDLDSNDVQRLLTSGEDYKVVEVELLYDEDGNFSTIDRAVGCVFTVNEGLIFKKIKVPGVTLERGADAIDAFDSTLYLTLSMLLKVHAAVISETGGIGAGVEYEDPDEI